MFNPGYWRPLGLSRSLPSLSGVAGFRLCKFLKCENLLEGLSAERLSPILAISGAWYLSCSAIPASSAASSASVIDSGDTGRSLCDGLGGS